MNTLHRLLAAGCCILGAVTLAAQAAAPGAISGRVSDAATKLTLAGVRVTVDGTAGQTYTDTAGAYQLAGVPAGPHTVEFDYVGYPRLAETVTVAAGQQVTLDASFGADTVRLEKFVIEGSLVGTARAINQERSASALTAIIASDAIGQFPDQNAAESLQRVPGVALYRDQGEGRFIIIRGINAQYNHVTLNGANLATPEAGSRNAPLDVIGSDSLAAVEVSKVITPDQEAEGLGGSVNLRTRSAFDAEGRQASLNGQTLYNHQRGKYGYKFDGTYGDLFAGGKLGLLVSASTQRRPFGSYNYEEGDGWSRIAAADSPDGRAHAFLNEIAFRDYEIVRTRRSVNVAADYKPDAATTIYLRSSFADFNDEEKRWVTTIPFAKGDIVALDDTSASVTGAKGASKRLRMREKDQKLSTAELGFETTREAWTLDGALDASKGREEKPSELEARFDAGGKTDWNYAFTDPYHVTVTSSGGADPDDPATFDKVKGTVKQAFGEETSRGLRANARRDFDAAGVASYVKIGGLYRAKDKTLDKEESDIADSPDGYTFAGLAETAGGYPYFTGPRIDATALRALFDRERDSFVLERSLEDSLLADFDSSEKVGAAYLMGGATLGDLQLIAGARVEHTRFETTGWQGITDTAGDTAYSRARTDHDYTNWLPGVILRYNATKRLVLRASLTKTLARPDFEQTAISRSVSDDDETVTQGNPGLKPLESVNWDASAEYYLPSLGVVSAAVFYKDIKHFTYQTETGTDPAFDDYTLVTYANGSRGHIAGLELAYQQQLRFLPAPFDGLGLLANATFSDSSAEYPTRPDETLDFVGQSKVIGNVGLTYEKRGFFVRLAGNFRSKRLREDEPIGGSADEDRYVDRFFQLDLSTSYRLTPNCEVFAEMVNLTNEPFRVYFGGGGAKKLVQREEYGWSSNLGLRWKL